MATLQEKLERIIHSGLVEARAELEVLPNGDVCGHVISTEFDGKMYEDRRKRLSRLWEKGVRDGELSSDDVAKISTLLTYTPAEWGVPLPGLDKQTRT